MEEDSTEEHHRDDRVGYRRPPRNTRFAKGKSGNPAGRPRGRHKHAPYEAVLGQMVTIREGGTARRVTAAEAFLLQLAKRGVEGDGAAARASLALIEQAMSGQGTQEPLTIVLTSVARRRRDIRSGSAEDGHKARSVPRDRAHGARAVACRSRIGAPPPAADRRRAARRLEGYAHATKGPMAAMVERISLSTLCSDGCSKSNNLAAERTGILEGLERY